MATREQSPPPMAAFFLGLHRLHFFLLTNDLNVATDRRQLGDPVIASEAKGNSAPAVQFTNLMYISTLSSHPCIPTLLNTRYSPYRELLNCQRYAQLDRHTPQFQPKEHASWTVRRSLRNVPQLTSHLPDMPSCRYTTFSRASLRSCMACLTAAFSSRSF